jgi:hypothetical protein
MYHRRVATVATVEVRDGRPVLVRTATEDSARLRAEAAALAALAGPGVPALLDVQDDGRRLQVITALPPPLALAGLDGPMLAGAFAALAATLARAHACGLLHGPIDDSDVRIEGAEVQLAGWGKDTSGLQPADDVASLGRRLEHVATTPILRNIAARATASDPSARPTMSGLAATLHAAAGVSPRSSRRRRRPVSVLVPAAAVALVVLAVPRHHGRAGSGQAIVTTQTIAPTSSTTSTTPPIRPPSGVKVAGNTVERDGVRWTVGRPDDVLAVGDFACNGSITAAVLRPATGQVWLFAEWAGERAPIAGYPLAKVPGAVRLTVRPVGRCDRLEAVDAGGQSTTVG